jgi:hypothetical protein
VNAAHSQLRGRLLHCGVFSDLFVADLARHTRDRSNLTCDAFGLEVLKGDKQNPWPAEFDRVTTAEQIAPADSSQLATWQQTRERDDAALLSRGFDRSLVGYDLYHFHTLFVKVLWQLQQIPTDRPVVLSIWGSDLLRVAGAYEYERQLQAIERANLITMQSLELREIFLAKFGRQWRKKVRLTTFGTARLPMLKRKVDTETARAFKARHGWIDAEKVIVLGHAATPFDQHLPALSELGRLPVEVKERVALILPMAYGGSDAYVRLVEDQLRATGIRGTILRKMLGDEEIVCLRQLSDVFVYVPESDALSGSVQEALYAGNAVVTGAWLPYYSRLIRAGLPLTTIESMDELPMALGFACDGEPMIDEVERGVIEKLCAWPGCIGGWLDVYAEAMGR